MCTLTAPSLSSSFVFSSQVYSRRRLRLAQPCGRRRHHRRRRCRARRHDGAARPADEAALDRAGEPRRVRGDTEGQRRTRADGGVRPRRPLARRCGGFGTRAPAGRNAARVGSAPRRLSGRIAAHRGQRGCRRRRAGRRQGAQQQLDHRRRPAAASRGGHGVVHAAGGRSPGLVFVCRPSFSFPPLFVTYTHHTLTHTHTDTHARPHPGDRRRRLRMAVRSRKTTRRRGCASWRCTRSSPWWRRPARTRRY